MIVSSGSATVLSVLLYSFLYGPDLPLFPPPLLQLGRTAHSDSTDRQRYTRGGRGAVRWYENSVHCCHDHVAVAFNRTTSASAALTVCCFPCKIMCTCSSVLPGRSNEGLSGYRHCQKRHCRLHSDTLVHKPQISPHAIAGKHQYHTIPGKQSKIYDSRYPVQNGQCT